MRGKNILWLSIIAMLLSVMVMNVGINLTAATNPKARIYLDPTRIPEPGALGRPGDEYMVSVKIDDVKDLWAVQFTVKYAPWVSVLNAHGFNEETFMSEDGSHPTAFYYTVDAFHGTCTLVIMRNGPEPRVGASGSGTLATFNFTVVEAGESPIDIVDPILLDSDVNYIPCSTSGSYYHGSTASLVRVNMPDGRKVRVGETFTIQSKVRNDGDMPLNVTVRFSIDRAEDGRRIILRNGQTYLGGGFGEPPPFPSEYLYLDEFNEWYYEWDNPATNALGTPDGNYIESGTNAAWASLYSFEDIDLAGRAISDIVLTGYTQYPNGATEGADIDMYGFTSTSSFGWLGSLYGTPDWDWHGVRWTADLVTDVLPELRDETELNNFEVLIYNYYGDAPDIMRVDSLQLKVDFAGIIPVTPGTFEIQPGEELELEAVTWVTRAEHMGSYDLTATIEYSSEFSSWNYWGSKQKTLFFWIVEP